MTVDLLPAFIQTHYEIFEWKHACAILHQDFRKEWDDIVEVLTAFRLKKSDVSAAGGNRSPISRLADEQFCKQRGWCEKGFDTSVLVDDVKISNPTHKIDCYKNRVALEMEWNNKDPFYDRDLNNFRILFDLRSISVGVIITRSDELQEVFNGIGKGSSYGASTTHMGKLLPRIQGGGAGGCPVLALGITKKLYMESE